MLQIPEIYNKYDLLLPGKFDGGYLLIALTEKIRNGEIAEQFTYADISNTLDEISLRFDRPPAQTERVLRILFHYYIRSYVEEPGKYYLTERTTTLVSFLTNAIENPYKDFPLKKSFEKAFHIKPGEIEDINDLEQKFGRQFIEGQKKIITDHLDVLEEELLEAYADINRILNSGEEDATTLVREFVIVFRKFGERAEDITHSLSSKEQFLRDLDALVEHFYTIFENHNHFSMPDQQEVLRSLKANWQKSREIRQEIENFFAHVDFKIRNIRRRIYNASEKLNELQEHFSVRAHMRLQLKRLQKIMLESATLENDEIVFHNHFPCKKIIQDETCFYHPGYHEYSSPVSNPIIEIPLEEEHREKHTQYIRMQNQRHEMIRQWVDIARQRLDKEKVLNEPELMEELAEQFDDETLVYQIVSEVKRELSFHKQVDFKPEYELKQIKQTGIVTWNIQMNKL